MAKDLNRHECIARVVSDPEIRFTQEGKAVASLRVVCNETWKDKNTGQKQERAEWINYVAFEPLSKVIADYVKKGSRLYLSGSLRTRQWEKDGIKRYSTEIIANDLQMLDSAQRSADSSKVERPELGRGSPSDQSRNEQPGFDDFEDSEIPF